MKTERHRRIIDSLEDSGQVAVAELATQLQVSEMTVRRDLQELEKAGLLRRVHGGATRSLGRAWEPPFRLRAGQSQDVKDRIAAVAAEFLHDGDAVGLDVGSTVLQLVPHLATRSNLTVVTASLRLASEVAARVALEQDLRLVLAGGVVRSEELSMTGQLAMETLGRIRLDTAFLGVGGMDPREGATEYNLEDAEVKRALIAVSQRVIVLADSSKLGTVCFASVAPLDAVDVVVTDAAADEAVVEQLRDAGVDVVVTD